MLNLDQVPPQQDLHDGRASTRADEGPVAPIASISLPVSSQTRVDVVVAGGGLGGVVAAIAASEAGARTLLIESQPFLGGNAVTGIPLSSFRQHGGGELVIKGIPLRLLTRLAEGGAVGGDPHRDDWLPVNPEALQLQLMMMLAEAGVRVLCHARVISVERRGRRIVGLGVVNHSGSVELMQASQFVDATGDAQLSYLAGLTTPMGRQRDGKTQNMTLMFSVAGVSEDRVASNEELQSLWREYSAEAILRNERQDPGYTVIPGKPGWRSFNATRIVVSKGVDSWQLTEAEFEGRRQVDEFVHQFLKPMVPGFDQAYLAQIAARVGVRETRRISGVYTVQTQDLLSGRVFDDTVGCSSGSIEVHEPDRPAARWQTVRAGGFYTIPYRSLTAREVTNLFAAGRCVSASHEALSALRVLATAMVSGQAAGTAAALNARTDGDSHFLDIDALQQHLRMEGGVMLGTEPHLSSRDTEV